MFKNISLFAALCFLCTTPFVASAHERQLFNIGGTDYLFVVGSLGEPVVVDDKTGVDLRVFVADPADPTNASAAGGIPVLGLESLFKVEISAGDKKKTFDLTTVYGTPGSYKAVFFPTVVTTLNYRLIGKLNNTDVDINFTCNPAGHVVAPEDKSEVALTSGVTRKFKAGQFGCPMAKEELGFPEDSMSFFGMHESMHGETSAIMKEAGKQAKSSGATGLAFGLIGTVLGVVALIRTRKPKV